MENFTFDTIEYVRPDYDAARKCWESAAQRVKETQSYGELKAVMEEGKPHGGSSGDDVHGMHGPQYARYDRYFL